MANFTAIGTYVLVLSVLTVFMMVILIRQQRSPKDMSIWLLSGIVGLLLGAAVSAALVQGLGYEVVKSDVPDENAPPVEAQPNISAPGGGGGPPGGMAMGGPGGGRGGPGGGMGMSMGGGGGGGGNNPKRQLTSLVRKLELLTGDIEIELTEQQATRLGELLAEIESSETMTDDEATQKYDQILLVLSDEQKQKEQIIALPGGGRGGPGGGMGMGMGAGGGPGGPPGGGRGGPGGGRGGPPGGGRGGPGGGQAEPDDANPFASDENKKALESLRARLSGSAEASSPAEASEASDTDPTARPELNTESEATTEPEATTEGDTTTEPEASTEGDSAP